MKIFEVDTSQLERKAGLVPYVVWNGIPYLLVMKPSDPAWGGSLFQIAKGQVEQGEDTLGAAFREGQEELGVRSKDIQDKPKLAVKTVITDNSDEGRVPYEFYVYTTKLASKKISGKPHFETGETGWITQDDIGKTRADQQAILRHIFQNI